MRSNTRTRSEASASDASPRSRLCLRESTKTPAEDRSPPSTILASEAVAERQTLAQRAAMGHASMSCRSWFSPSSWCRHPLHSGNALRLREQCQGGDYYTPSYAARLWPINSADLWPMGPRLRLARVRNNPSGGS